MSSRQDDYKFMQIIDAMASINQKVNLIGVVAETSIPKYTRGTDCFCSVKIIDESRQNPGISVNVFAETMDKLPQVQSVGDIILFSHVVIKAHASEVNAVFNKKFSSFALYEGKHDTSFVPYQVSDKYRPREEDKKLIANLRKWLTDHKVDTGPSELLSLNEIREGRLNLVCKIIHIWEVTRDEWMLFVWDGTDTPPVTITRKLDNEENDPLPLQLERFPLSRDTLCTFPAVGTVLRVTIERANEKLGIKFLNAGRWVKFVNVKCEVHDTLWRTVLSPFSKLCYLPDNDDIVLQRQRWYDERLSTKWGRMPLLCFPWPSRITETDYPKVTFMTLMNVLTYPEVTAKFKCIVRVVAVLPWRTEDFRSPRGIFRIRLTLEDPTARIHSFLYADDGVTFFGNCHSAEDLKRKRDTLLGVADENEDARNPPWVQVCLKSYYVNKQDVWGSRNYRIFATRLTG